MFYHIEPQFLWCVIAELPFIENWISLNGENGMIEAVAVGTVGVVLGFGLSEVATYLREMRTEKRQTRLVRTMVSLEVEENLRLLWQFWEAVRDLPDSADEDALNFSRRLIEVPLPPWSHRAWESQMSSLAVALTPLEIRRVHVHHSRLERVSAIRTQLHAFAAKQHADLTAARDEKGLVWSPGSIPRDFDWNAPDLWPECVHIIKELQETGNPLPEEARGVSQ